MVRGTAATPPRMRRSCADACRCCSNPYVELVLNDGQVMTTETKKKTVDPVWQDAFEFDASARHAARAALSSRSPRADARAAPSARAC